MSESRDAAKRHPATEKAWAWLDSPDGIAQLSPDRREKCAEALRTIDAIFNEWDEEVFGDERRAAEDMLSRGLTP